MILNRLDALAQREALEAGSVSVRALLEAHLERIAEREPAVQAFAHVDAEGARRTADSLDRAGVRGLLGGLPLGIKDIIDTADQPTAYGSVIYEAHRPSVDAASVAMLRAAGAVIVGKTVTAEFAHRLPGPTRNPLDLSRTPGGSSSGSAAAVADWMLPLALGTQTTASVIRPASFCGIVGYRPTFGLMSCAGVKPSSPSFDTLGVFGRTVRDCALMRDALLGAELRLPAGEGGALRFGFCRTPFWDRVEPRAAAAMERAVARLAQVSAVGEVVLPDALARIAKAHRTVSSYELAAGLATERHQHPSGLSPLLRDGKMAEGLAVTPEAYVEAVAALEHARLSAADLFASWDVIVAPSVSGIADIGLSSTGPAEFSSIWTALHGPCMTIPLAERIDGMPIGLQLIAARGRDHLLFEAAEHAAGAFGPRPD